jgi:hypothetical protein
MAAAPIGEIARRYVADANQPHTLSLLHGAIADKLPDGERVEAAAPIIEAMRSAQGSDALNALADLLQSMWRENLQCHPKTASVCALVARATAELAQQVAQSSDQNSNQQYAFEMLLKRIGPEQAPEIVALLQKLRSPDESDPRFDGGLYLALGRLSPRDARNHFKLIFDKLAAGAPRQGLATEQALQEVTARLADDQMPADLAEVLRQYSRTKDKARLSPAVTTALNAAEGALRSRPDGEAPILAGVGPLLSRAAYLIQQEEASNTPGSMDKAWTSSANRVLPALQAVLEGLAGPDRPPDPATLDPLVKGLTEPDPDPLDLQAIVEAIPAVASRLSPNQAARVQGSLRSIIGWTSDISIAAPAAVAFRGFAATQPAPTRTQSILALLKYPGGGDVTSALLEGQGVEPAAGSNDSKLELQHYLQALEQNPSSSASVSAMPPCPAPYRRGLSCR